ncbi:UNVERIFIED_CONTAM: hypothetical protein Slati_0744200 [Sesamum latifolium]|uniref:Uncharacterized protein n=1 Tax=Sesamum latifolium TaxID=2727402 RepID=A0AAW2XQF5_9LAMI
MAREHRSFPAGQTASTVTSGMAGSTMRDANSDKKHRYEKVPRILPVLFRH